MVPADCDFLRKQFKVDTTPHLKDLYEHITSQYASEWEVIGTLLGLLSGEMEAIEAEYPTNVKWCCNQMLEKWLEVDPTASWGKLLTVIESPAVSASHSSPDKGMQPAEYEVFIQYYNTLKESLKNYSHLLYHGGSYREIITYFMEFTSSRRPSRYSHAAAGQPSDTEVLLAEVAIQLYSGNTRLFYEMLKVMRTITWDDKVCELAAEVETKIESYIPHTSYGSQLIELDIFMQYYGKLMVQMSFEDVNELHFSYWEAGIMADNDIKLIYYETTPGVYIQEIILIRMANHLLSGNFILFHKMLEILQSCRNPIIDRFVGEIHATLNYKFSTGMQPAEYEVFVQYYNTLKESLKNYSHLLYHGGSHREIITYFMEFTSSHPPSQYSHAATEQPSDTEVLLAEVAIQLYSGNTRLFYEMLKVMRTITWDDKVCELAAEVEAKVESYIPHTSYGSQLIELDVFMQYYRKLLAQMSLINVYKLQFSYLEAGIIAVNDIKLIIFHHYKTTPGVCIQEIILIRMANHLLSGNFILLHKMLEILQSCGNPIIDRIVGEIHATLNYKFSTGEEVHFISNFVPVLSKTFDHHGGEMIIEEHDVTITVPELAISEGDKVEFQAIVSLTGPYQLPDGYDLVSAFVWIEADYRFRKLVKITIPHFASIENLDQRFDVVVLTADEKDLVLNENGDSLLQLHESVYDYQYEVNDDYCDYYTDHFCSKCLARRRSFIFRLFNRLTSSPAVVPNPSRTRLIVFFCVPDDYATADELLIELCICYSLKYCLQTVNKSYKQRKMLSDKSRHVLWTVAIDNQKCQNFRILYEDDCPGWKIKPIGLERIKVSDLDFHTYASPEDLRAEEELNVYPPRFKISVNRLSHDKKLELDFKIALETDGDSATDEFIKIPLTIGKPTTEVSSVPASTTDSVGFSQNEILQQEPEIGDLFEFVVPLIKPHWEDVAFTALRFDIPTVEGIQKTHLNDIKKCCQEMFKIWLITQHGVKPKTWSTLLTQLKKVEELVAATEVIEKRLKK